jgi:hypothetical protein
MQEETSVQRSSFINLAHGGSSDRLEQELAEQTGAEAETDFHADLGLDASLDSDSSGSLESSESSPGLIATAEDEDLVVKVRDLNFLVWSWRSQ